MKTYRCYNTLLREVKGWPTLDKAPAIEIMDEENGFCYFIQFGENPLVSVFSYRDGEIDELLEEIKL
jgi:hypothetical protein